MKNTKCCPKCGSKNIVCVPDNAHRYLANSIAITNIAWVKRIPVTRFAKVCLVQNILSKNQNAPGEFSFECKATKKTVNPIY